MHHSTWLSLASIPLIGIVALTAQQPKTFKARLSPVPIDVIAFVRLGDTADRGTSMRCSLKIVKASRSASSKTAVP